LLAFIAIPLAHTPSNSCSAVRAEAQEMLVSPDQQSNAERKKEQPPSDLGEPRPRQNNTGERNQIHQAGDHQNLTIAEHGVKSCEDQQMPNNHSTIANDNHSAI
jgi:hypothetical protein